MLVEKVFPNPPHLFPLLHLSLSQLPMHPFCSFLLRSLLPGERVLWHPGLQAVSSFLDSLFYVVRRELRVLLLWLKCRSQMVFAEAFMALPRYAKAESRYTGVGRATLALFSSNYVTARISINRFMMPLRCWVDATQWSCRDCQRQAGILKCIIILVMKLILTHHMSPVKILSIRFKCKSRQLFGNLKCRCKAVGTTNIPKCPLPDPQWSFFSWNIWELK